MADREHIPNETVRQLFLEVGFRCPLCPNTEPLQVCHIEDHATTGNDNFTNLIVLCAACHGRQKPGSNPRQINVFALKRLKQNLMMLNGRYTDLERRFLNMAMDMMEQRQALLALNLHESMYLLVKGLLDDELATCEVIPSGMAGNSRGVPITNNGILLQLSSKGGDFVRNLLRTRQQLSAPDNSESTRSNDFG